MKKKFMLTTNKDGTQIQFDPNQIQVAYDKQQYYHKYNTPVKFYCPTENFQKWIITDTNGNVKQVFDNPMRLTKYSNITIQAYILEG